MPSAQTTRHLPVHECAILDLVPILSQHRPATHVLLQLLKHNCKYNCMLCCRINNNHCPKWSTTHASPPLLSQKIIQMSHLQPHIPCHQHRYLLTRARNHPALLTLRQPHRHLTHIHSRQPRLLL